jgi:hypothetical protein
MKKKTSPMIPRHLKVIGVVALWAASILASGGLFLVTFMGLGMRGEPAGPIEFFSTMGMVLLISLGLFAVCLVVTCLTFFLGNN